MRNMFNTAIALSFLSLLLLTPVTFSEKCNPQDKKVLLRIKQELNNPYLLASWDPKTDCCDWYCLKCDIKTHRVTDLFIQDSVPYTNLSGQIPPSVGDLPYLQYLEFHKLPSHHINHQPTHSKNNSQPSTPNLFPHRSALALLPLPSSSSIEMAQVQVQPQNAMTGPNGGAAAAAGGNQFVTTSLYVGDLDVNVTDSQLYDLFNQLGQVVFVRVTAPNHVLFGVRALDPG